MGRSQTRPCHRRVLAVDCARGVALIGMVVFHVAWDLHYFGFSAVDPNVDVGLQGLGQGVAAVFLFLSGFSLVLAAQAGATVGRELIRLLRIGSAALIVTLATWLVAPAQAILFGILHCVLVTNGAALALRRGPTILLLAVAAVCLSLPGLSRGTASGPVWSWLGLAATEPATLDFRPVFPWIGVVLLGVTAARTTVTRRLGQWQPRSRIPHWIGAAGRHSLALYLVHQPVAFVALYLAASAVGVSQTQHVLLSDPGEATAFLRQCGSACMAKGSDRQLCLSTCHRVMTDILRKQQEGMERAPTRAPDDGPRDQTSRACLARDTQPPPQLTPIR